MSIGRIIDREQEGFTLIEVLVSLIIGTLILGGVMGMLGATLQFRKKVIDRREQWPVLDMAAQKLLTNPELISEGSITFKDLPGSPELKITKTAISLESGIASAAGQIPRRELYRVKLTYLKTHLELSLIYAPRSESEKKLGKQ